jgi:predicted metal-dependent phosphoesterase TrpH
MFVLIIEWFNVVGIAINIIPVVAEVMTGYDKHIIHILLLIIQRKNIKWILHIMQLAPLI